MTDQKLSPGDEFDKALRARAGGFGVTLGGAERAGLRAYFEVVARWNARLHLVAPCPPAEFAARHVLESLLALRFLTPGASFVDVGSGAGLPAVPCLIVRPDLRATLFESSQKKSIFLREALREVGRAEAAAVVARRFEDSEPPAADFLTCRAIERFAEILPGLVGWAARVPVLLLFGGPALSDALDKLPLAVETARVPGSERRFLHVVRR
ncbi:MAG TPA: RsmG family class I SAM-dependent methyltransferase [Pyrinomonadaceae bacterium]|nr:RsmG family class I SAM-dependent methyltransferase [Pyrinomonadaceae bacterium]